MTTVTGPLWGVNIAFFALAIGFGVAFIATSTSKSFYKWRMNSCSVKGIFETGQPLSYNIDLTVDIGWRQMTATYVDSAAGPYCFEDSVEQGEVYAIGDFEDNSAGPAGIGMAVSWALAVLVALVTIVAMLKAISGNYKGMNLVKLMNLTILMTLGIITSTTVFWWMVEGKFGNRTEALVPRLRDLVLEAAERCNNNEVAPCNAKEYHIITPGWSLALGITSMFLYGFGTLMLWLMAARVQSLNNISAEDAAGVEAAKIPRGDFIVEKQSVQPEDGIKSKDGRSAKTGMRAPNSTVRDMHEAPDPMTYALEEGSDEEGMGDDDDEDRVMYKNHQVHHNVINHSQANRTQEVVDSRRQQQYQRGYSRGTSGNSYRSGMGGQSFEERSEGDFSDASSARYYGQNQGRYRSESSSRGDSFEESR